MAEPVPIPSGPSASASVLGRGSLYTVATAGPALAAVAVIPVVTRLLPVQEYDLVAVCLVIVQVGFILGALGMGAAVTRQYILAAEGVAGARGLVVQGTLLAVLLVGLATASGPAWTAAVVGRPFSVEIALALVACLGGAVMLLAQAFLRGADRPGAYVALAVLAGLGGPLVGLAAVVLVEERAVLYLVGIAAGYLVAAAVGLVLVLRTGRTSATWAGLRTALRIGVPTVPHQVSLYVALAGLVVIADRVLGEGGRANVALMIGAGATVVTAALNNAWAPIVYRTAPGRRGAVLTETTGTIAWLTVALGGLVALLSPWILGVAAPDSYEPTSLTVTVALAGAAALPSVFYLASGHLVFAGGRTGWLAVTTPLAVLAGLAWAALLAPRWGMSAIGSGYLVTYVALAVATTLVQRRVSTEAWWPPVLRWAGLAWLCATAAGAWLPVDGVTSALRPALALLVTAAALVVVRRRLRAAGGAWSKDLPTVVHE